MSNRVVLVVATTPAISSESVLLGHTFAPTARRRTSSGPWKRSFMARRSWARLARADDAPTELAGSGREVS